MSDPFSTPAKELPRDQWGRPLITPPEGGTPVAYTRVTTFVGPLEDTYHLGQWSQRMVAVGMTKRPDLQLAVSAIEDINEKYSKQKLNRITKDAREAAGAGAKALTGTAMHTYSERIDACDTQEAKDAVIETAPAPYRDDLRAYVKITRYFEVVDMEGFCVVDHLRTGGSYDRILRVTAEGLAQYEADYGTPMRYPSRVDGEDGALVQAGDTFIGDVKTGHVDMGAGKIAMQMGVYSRAKKYDHTDGSRTDLPGDPRQDWGIVIHLPAGEGYAELLWFDIDAGYDAAERLAHEVHQWRKRKDISYSFARVNEAKPKGPSVTEQIGAATSYDALVEIHRANALTWTPGLTQLAKARKEELEKA